MLKIEITIDTLCTTYERKFRIAKEEAKVISKILLDHAEE